MTKTNNRKNNKVLLGASTLAVLLGVGAYQGINAATATLPMIAKLVRAIEITMDQSLDFGTLAMTLDRTGNARLDPSADQLFIDGNSGLTLAGGEPRAGRLRIKGASMPLAISVEDTQVRMTNGTGTVLVNNFNLITPNGGNKATITPGEGTVSLSVSVGATINTTSRQLTGTYVGSTRVFANYQ